VALHLVPYIDKKHVQTSLRNFAISFWEYVTKIFKNFACLSCQ
jgi:hypothetical protein